jgi:hypothetical protein
MNDIFLNCSRLNEREEGNGREVTIGRINRKGGEGIWAKRKEIWI